MLWCGVMSQGDLCIINTSIDPAQSLHSKCPVSRWRHAAVTKQTDYTHHYRGLDDTRMYLFTVTRGQLLSKIASNQTEVYYFWTDLH